MQFSGKTPNGLRYPADFYAEFHAAAVLHDRKVAVRRWRSIVDERVEEMRQRLERLELAVYSDPGARERMKFNEMCERVVLVAKGEGMIAPPIREEPPL
jgi:hypothetical protein